MQIISETSLNLLKSFGFTPESPLVVGYSCGADSTALIHALSLAGIPVIASYLHHNQRAEADLEKKLGQALCEDLKIPFVSGNADVPLMAKSFKIGLEEAGRMARYSFLRQVRDRAGAQYIATAHTRTDQVESILLHITRGSGLSGLAGMQFIENDLIRPILDVTREETHAYCATHCLWYSTDSGNEDLQHSRVRTRLNIVPELKKINPNIDESILRLSEIVRADNDFLSNATYAAMELNEIPLNKNLRFLTEKKEVCFQTSGLAGLPDSLLRRSIRTATEMFGGSLDYVQTMSICRSVREGLGGSITTEGGKVIIEVSKKDIHIRRSESFGNFREPIPSDTDGEIEFRELNWKISVLSNPINMPPLNLKRETMAATFNLSDVQKPLHLRSIQVGDKICPLGFDHLRKVSDLCSEYGLTPLARSHLPVICDMVGPLWIPGVVLGTRGIHREATSNSNGNGILYLEFFPFESFKLN